MRLTPGSVPRHCLPHQCCTSGLYIRYETNVPGPSGVGKTHIALALGLAACQKGRGVRFATASYLVHELILARDEKRQLRLQAQFARVTLLIIDELGYVPLSQTGSELLFDVFSQRYENVVLIVVAKLLAPYRRSAQAGPPGDFEHRHSLRRIQIQSGPAGCALTAGFDRRGPRPHARGLRILGSHIRPVPWIQTRTV